MTASTTGRPIPPEGHRRLFRECWRRRVRGRVPNAQSVRPHSRPQITFPPSHSDEAQIVETSIPVVTTSDVPEQDRLANAIVWGLGEGAGAGDGAAAIIKPVTGDLPILDLGHEKLHTP
jgi:hypothetical protein